MTEYEDGGRRMADDVLLHEAIAARENAYAPYSNFKVGAALLTRGGKVYTGCNVENQAYGPTLCAERVAVGKAISAGEKWHDFVAIAVVGSSVQPCTPCGECRQVLSEMFAKKAQDGVFGEPVDLLVIMIGSPETVGDRLVKTLKELLPYGFEL